MKYLLILCAIAAFASCQPNYNNKVVNRKVSTISCVFAPIQIMQGGIDSGFINVNTDHAGNPLLCDSVYTIEFTLYEKWHYGHTGSLWTGIAILIVGFLAYIIITSRGTDKRWTLAISFGTLFLGGGFVGGFYYFNEERNIKKSDYVHYIQKDGDLRNFPFDQAQAL